jgi:hypothetical protein
MLKFDQYLLTFSVATSTSDTLGSGTSVSSYSRRREFSTTPLCQPQNSNRLDRFPGEFHCGLDWLTSIHDRDEKCVRNLKEGNQLEYLGVHGMV